MTLSDHVPKVTLERRLTVGNIVTIATLLITMGITWGVFSTQASQMTDDVAAVRTAVKVLEDARYSDNSRMVRVETLLEQILDAVKP